MSFVIVAIGVFIAFAVEAMTGFGSIVIALSIGALVMDITQLMQWLVPLNIMMTGPLVYQHRHHIDHDLLFKQILPFMGTGTLTGLLVIDYIPAEYSKGLFALIICWFAIRSLAQLNAPAHNHLARRSLIFSAGITHGLFASGGPLLVYACARTPMAKERFRATLLSVWLTLNTGLCVWFLLFEGLASQTKSIMWLVPCVIAGAFLGNAWHKKVSQAFFSPLVFVMLLLVGVLLLVKTLSQFL
ncbi:TSUP family transporter [Alteromonas lipotrueae]|uniref:TSUP family transporter n=1 Tax=Alteromonas lipotrueae TaxID=2803814 RepID=UPI001C44BD08|nr:TSUP family transporter [Alteromonas lipotrueae]